MMDGGADGGGMLPPDQPPPPPPPPRRKEEGAGATGGPNRSAAAKIGVLGIGPFLPPQLFEYMPQGPRDMMALAFGGAKPLRKDEFRQMQEQVERIERRVEADRARRERDRERQRERADRDRLPPPSRARPDDRDRSRRVASRRPGDPWPT